MNEPYDIMIIGAGAAGLTAGIYSSRARLKTLILNEGAVGGQMVLTHEIANYPGVESISGYALANIMKKQAKDFGTAIKSNVKITRYGFDSEVKEVVLDDGRIFRAKAVIVTPGGRPRPLGIPGEETFKGKGISYCATCDGDFFTGKELVVVGGGNSALEEAVSLTKYASKVTIVHQFDHFQAFAHAIREAEENPKIDFVMESELREIRGVENVESVVIENLKTRDLTEKSVDGVFVFIGYLPNTESLKGVLPMNERGEIIVDGEMRTGITGVYSAGDSIAKRYRQITTAVADGTIAALSAAEYLRTQ
jgi:thioredoxin reductase (NADPH)